VPVRGPIQTDQPLIEAALRRLEFGWAGAAQRVRLCEGWLRPGDIVSVVVTAAARSIPPASGRATAIRGAATGHPPTQATALPAEGRLIAAPSART